MEIKKPTIAKMSEDERKQAINYIIENVPEFKHKTLTIETLAFCDELIEQVRSSQLSLAQLKKLVALSPEYLKKLQQIL